MKEDLTKVLGLLRDIHIKGEKLLKGTPPQHVIEWMKNTLHELYNFIPSKSPQYSQWSDLSNKYKNCENIIPATILTDIRRTLDLLKASAYYISTLDKVNIVDVPPENLVNIHYHHLQSLRDFVADKLINQLKEKVDGTTKKTALMHTYERMFLVVDSMIRLNNVRDFQMLSSGLRSILELYIDMLLLHRDLIERSANKFYKFASYIKRSRGKKIVDLKARYQLLKDNDPILDSLKHNPFINTKQIWGKDHLSHQHWSNLSIEERIGLIDNSKVADIFVHSYDYSNRLIHPGYLDFLRKDGKIVHLINWNSFFLSSLMLTEATSIINNECHILNEMKFEEAIENLQKNTQKEFMDEYITAGLSKQ